MMTLRKWPQPPVPPPKCCLPCLFRLQTLQGHSGANIARGHQAHNNTKWSNSWNSARPSSTSWQNNCSKEGRRHSGANTAESFENAFTHQELAKPHLQGLMHSCSSLQGLAVALLVCWGFEPFSLRAAVTWTSLGSQHPRMSCIERNPWGSLKSNSWQHVPVSFFCCSPFTSLQVLFLLNLLCPLLLSSILLFPFAFSSASTEAELSPSPGGSQNKQELVKY